MDITISWQKELFPELSMPSTPVNWGDIILKLLVKGCCESSEHAGNIQAFEPGADILDYRISELAEAQPLDPLKEGNAYFVWQGRVRLLGQSQQRSLPYSAALLGPGDLFGADHLFCQAPLSYQAVAASTCQVVRVPYAYLTFWADHSPPLSKYWSKRMEQRTQQLFFKRFTPLQTLPSRVLTRRLLSQIQELQIDAGTILGTAIRPYAGYFWLRSGRLASPTAPAQPLAIGYGWSSYDLDLADGVAQTPLRLFHLQRCLLEAPDLLPITSKLQSSC